MPLRTSIQQALQLAGIGAAVERIKQDLSDSIRRDDLDLPLQVRQPRNDTYARRLIFRDLELGVTAVAMTWAAGQQTSIHDHSGIWCVEGVVAGEMEVVQYELEEEFDNRFRFVAQAPVKAIIGTAGCLIPPFEHHVLRNASADTSITLHIYGGEMDRCNVYVPATDGWYERQSQELRYDD